MPDATLPRELRAVVFDVDGTLYKQPPLRRAMALRLIGAHVAHPFRGLTTLRILSAYRRGQEALREVPGTGGLGAAQLQFACRETGARPDEVQATVTRWMETAPLDLLARHAQPGMQQCIRDLHRRGMKLGVLSDYPADAKLVALGVGEQFHSVLCAQSNEVGVFKPNPRGILVSLERLGAQPPDALYVGDRVDVDAAAARAANVACVILSRRTPRRDDGFLSVRTFDELAHLLAGQHQSSGLSSGAQRHE